MRNKRRYSHERTEMTRVYYYIYFGHLWYYYYIRSLHNLSLEGVGSFTRFPAYYTYIDTKSILHLVKYFLTGVPVRSSLYKPIIIILQYLNVVCIKLSRHSNVLFNANYCGSTINYYKITIIIHRFTHWTHFNERAKNVDLYVAPYNNFMYTAHMHK